MAAHMLVRVKSNVIAFPMESGTLIVNFWGHASSDRMQVPAVVA